MRTSIGSARPWPLAAVVIVLIGATACAHGAKERPRAVASPSGALHGTTFWDAPLNAVGGGVLNVRVVDAEASDSSAILLGSASIPVARGAQTWGWRVPVSSEALTALPRAVVVIALVENGRVRDLASGTVGQLQYWSSAAAPQVLTPLALRLRPVSGP